MSKTALRTPIQLLVEKYFELKKWPMNNALFPRWIRPAKLLLSISGTPERAQEALELLANWAASKNLDWTLETVIKRWGDFENGNLKAQIKVEEAKPKLYTIDGDPARFDTLKDVWMVKPYHGNWVEYNGSVKDKLVPV